MKSTNYDKISKNRLRGNLFSIFIIISSVLFLLGLLSLIFVKTNSIGNYFKEQVVIGVYFDKNTNDIQIKQLEKLLTLNQNIVRIEYMSPQDAAENFTEEIGEDFTTFLGFNPLSSSLNINFKGEFIEKINTPFDILYFENKIISLQAKYEFNKRSLVNLRGYVIDKNERKIKKNNLQLQLTEKEINFLILFSQNNKPVTRQFILKNVWNYSSESDTHTVETHIHRLRKKILEKFDDNNFIKNSEKGYYI